MRHLPRLIMDWLERGDLVPLIVLVSAVHYAEILKRHDILPIAIAIGFLVDLGHYRWVRAAVRYHPAIPKAKGKRKPIQRERFARWSMAVGMTVLSLAYQQRFYGDWFYSVPLPLLIISLAWLGEKDKRSAPAEKPVVANVKILPAEQSEMLPEPKPEQFRYICGVCGYDKCLSQNALNGHQRKHSKKDNRQEKSIIVNTNGHKEKI